MVKIFFKNSDSDDKGKLNFIDFIKLLLPRCYDTTNVEKRYNEESN